jgi:hypothetical protein
MSTLESSWLLNNTVCFLGGEDVHHLSWVMLTGGPVAVRLPLKLQGEI